jgi:hypothetical protein
MASEWKRLTMQNGAWVATVTALVAGALLWYERPAPLYPTTRDEAEARFALLERTVAQASAPFATITNVVGLYPSRWFWAGTGSGEQTAPELTKRLAGDFLNLWDLGGVGGLQRSVADYEFVVADADRIDYDWWTNNLYAEADYFGDYQYLHTNTLYMCTNILEQVGRALSAMRWTLEDDNSWGGPEPVTNTWVRWQGEWCIRDELADAFADALDSWAAAGPSVGLSALPIDTLDGMTNCPLRYHVARVSWTETITNTWAVLVEEWAVFQQRVAWAPAATNVMAWHVGAFATNNAALDIDEFYHPAGVTGTWEIASAPLTDLGGGTYGFAECLFDWDGRIPRVEIAGRIPPVEDPYYGSRVAGWSRHTWEAFAGDWRFQCFTNRAAFW